MFMQSSIGAVEIRRNVQTDNISIVEIDEDVYSSIEYDRYINNLVSRLDEDMRDYMLLEQRFIDAIRESLEFQEFSSTVKPKITLENFEKLEKCDEITNCSICFENMKDNIKLKCNHIYCTGCIKKWLTERSDTCPTCREKI